MNNQLMNQLLWAIKKVVELKKYPLFLEWLQLETTTDAVSLETLITLYYNCPHHRRSVTVRISETLLVAQRGNPNLYYHLAQSLLADLVDEKNGYYRQVMDKLLGSAPKYI